MPTSTVKEWPGEGYRFLDRASDLLVPNQDEYFAFGDRVWKPVSIGGKPAKGSVYRRKIHCCAKCGERITQQAFKSQTDEIICGLCADEVRNGERG